MVSPDDKNVYVVAWGASSKGFSGVLEFARAKDGMLSALPAEYDCVTAAATNECGTTKARGLKDPRSIALSPDGQHAYVTADGSQAVAAFRRDPPRGGLRQLSAPDDCVAHVDTGANCGRAHAGLADPGGIALSPDGRHVYVTSLGVDVLARNEETGGLTELPSPASGPGTTLSRSIVVSPDGKNVYTASRSGGSLASYTRNANSGAIAQLTGPDACVELATNGCSQDSTAGPVSAQGLAISPDGRHLYVVSDGSKVIALARDMETGAVSKLPPPNDCVTGQSEGCARTGLHGFDVPTSLAISPDGLSVYVVSTTSFGGGGIVALSRDPETGGLAQLEAPYDCLTANASGCGVNGFTTLREPMAVGISPNGDSVYPVTWPSSGPGSIVTLSRNVPSCRDSVVTVANAEEVSIPLTCTDPSGAPLTLQITAWPEWGNLGPIDQASGTVVFTAGPVYRGSDSFAFRANDGSFDSPPATVHLSITPPSSTAPPEPGSASGDPPTAGGAGDQADEPQATSRPGAPGAVAGPRLPTPAILRAGPPRVRMRRGLPVVHTGVVVQCPRETERCFAGAALTARVRSRGRSSMLMVGRGSASVPSADSREIVIRSRRRSTKAWRHRGCTRMLLQVNASAAGGNFWQRLVVLRLRHPAAGQGRCRGK